MSTRLKKLAAAFGLALGMSLSVAQAAPASGSDNQFTKMWAGGAGENEGKTVFDTRCAQCHTQNVPKVPDVGLLKMMSPKSIYNALTIGPMQPQAVGLTEDQKRQVAEYLTGRQLSTSPASSRLKMCKGKHLKFDESDQPFGAGWGLTPGSTHFVNDSQTALRKDNVGRLKLKWAFAYPDGVQARSQPSLAGGAVYVGGDDGTVYALDRETGCVRWTFSAEAEVRHQVIISPWTDEKSGAVAYFGDLNGNAFAVNARTGALIWKKHLHEHAAAGVTASPLLHNGVLYVGMSSLENGPAVDPNFVCCTFRGVVVALDAATGDERWRFYTIDQPAKLQSKSSVGVDRFGPSGASVWGTPVADDKRGLLYLGTGQNYSAPSTKTSDAMFALDLKTGKVKWTYQALKLDAWNTGCWGHGPNCPEKEKPVDFDFSTGLMLVTSSNGRDYLVGGQKSGLLTAVDPDTGKAVWTNKVGAGGLLGGLHFGLAAGKDVVYAPVADINDDQVPSEPRKPGLYALDLATGAFLWKAPLKDECAGRPYCRVANSAAVTATPDLVLAGGVDGYLRIHDAKTGEVVWKYDTTQEVKTVSGEVAHGGSMSGGSAPIPAGKDLFVNSGYAFAASMPGNVLLVFELGR